jgi:hypothetical protein
MASEIDAELMNLFGRWTFASAQVKRRDELKVDQETVEAAARQVIAARGQLEQQRAIVDALDEDTALALCLWLRDPANANSLLKQARAKPRKLR